MNVHAFNLLLQ